MKIWYPKNPMMSHHVSERKTKKKNLCGNTQALQVSDTPMWPKLGDFSAFFHDFESHPIHF